MSTSEEDANELLQKQGFLVIGAVNPRPLKRGEIVPHLRHGGTGWLNHPVVVIAESNAEEWQRQRAYFGHPPEDIPEGSLFYRVVAE
jgi:hypothetical protein